MSIMVIIIVAPLFVTICVLLLYTQGREIFYFGTRLGESQKKFLIIKFRTLCPVRAKAMTRDCTLPKDANIETPLGRVLRETRLDELPQLINILRGEMNICGPRPVRPEIAAIERTRIPNYDLRFTVKPGLIGPTQAFFGHGASKRVRARMNNRLVTRPVSIIAELGLFARIGLLVLVRTLQNLARCALSARSSTVARRDIWLASEEDDKLCFVEEIGMRRIKVRGLQGSTGIGYAVLCIRLRSGAIRKARIMLSRAQTFGVFNYAAETEFGEFIIERYALGLVVVQPEVAALAVEEERPGTLTKAWA